MEKRTPHFALDSIKATFTTAASLRMTKTAQDVYHVPFEGLVLYVKFTTDAQGYLVISFKEK